MIQLANFSADSNADIDEDSPTILISEMKHLLIIR